MVTPYELRKGAVKIVDAIHDANPHTILLGGTSSKPAFSLIRAVWKKRYPDKKMPQHFPLANATEKHVTGKKVVIFEELIASGRTIERLHTLYVSQLRPAEVVKMALVNAEPNNKHPNVITGIAHAGHLGMDLGVDWRSNLKSMIHAGEKNEARILARQIREKREELRSIARLVKRK